jgi:hypothetical protein
MKNYLRCCVICAAVLLGGCVSSVHPIQELVRSPDKWDKQVVSMQGYLCVDLFVAYLASSTECDEIAQEKKGEFNIELVLDKQQMQLARKLKSGTRVIIKGRFRAPPPGAIRMTSGALLGYSIVVLSIKTD